MRQADVCPKVHQAAKAEALSHLLLLCLQDPAWGAALGGAAKRHRSFALPNALCTGGSHREDGLGDAGKLFDLPQDHYRTSARCRWTGRALGEGTQKY